MRCGVDMQYYNSEHIYIIKPLLIPKQPTDHEYICRTCYNRFKNRE
jgi:hypothetical protein